MGSQNKPLTTQEFRMGASRFALEMIFRYAGVWLITLAAIALAGVIFGLVVDIRWFVLGLMVSFIIFPLLLAFLYYYYALRRDCVVNYLPHRLSIMPDSGLVATMRVDENTERNETFAWESLFPYKIGSNSAVVPMKAPLKGFIWIPASAFGSEADMVEFFKALDLYINK